MNLGLNTERIDAMQHTSKGPAPGFATHPGYEIQLTPINKTVRVFLGDAVVAESRAAIELIEGGYPPRYYVPMSDVRAQALTPNQHSTHCPFKGDASYWTVNVAGQSIENGAWSYVEPFDECVSVAGYVSFYGEKLSITLS
ncbi:MAG: hypothetical protein ACI8W7_004078 [Gammaproteobacteria bacterium]|jgi:uncharacterized protein (DUF427 family)